MRDAYVQVALTYFRRPWATWRGILITGGWSVFAVAMTLAAFGRHGTPDVFAFMLPFFFLFLFLAAHVKDQFADARTRLTPDFRRVHVAVAVAVILAVGVFFPAAITVALGLRSVGITAIWISCLGAVLWCVVTNSLWAVWLPTVAFIVAARDSVRNALGGFISGEDESLAVVVLLAGAALCCHAMLRLVRLTEDDPKSYRRIEWDRNVNQARMTGPNVPDSGSLWQRFGDWAMDRAMDALMRHVRNASVSWWSRIRRWQVNASPFPAAMMTFVIGMMSLCFYVMLLSSVTAIKTDMAALKGMLMFLYVFPASSALGQLMGRWPLVGREVLLPVKRTDYLRQLGLGVAWNHLQSWLGMAVALALLVAINAPDSVVSGSHFRLILFSGMAQVLAFGVAVWATTLGSRAGALAALIVTLMTVFIVAATCQSPRPAENYLIQAGLILAAIGLLLVWMGYRRWLVLDLA